MDSVFTKIIKKEISSFTVYEDSNVIAFLDIKPVKMGHTLVVPKKQIDYIFDLDIHLQLIFLNVLSHYLIHRHHLITIYV